MESKTMGSFIAALRRASGMTQKDLAEKLNVSDKSVSRWERDEGAPDLALVPVIAEVFGVTCDELLRGQRSDRTQPQESPKAEKLRRHILNAARTRFRTRSLISVGIGLLGLIAALICNLGFLRASLGFFAELSFALMSVLCQLAFLSLDWSAAGDEDSEDAPQFRIHLLRWTAYTWIANLVFLAFCLPLAEYLDLPHISIGAASWFGHGILAVGIVLVILIPGWLMIQFRLIARSNAPEKSKQAASHNRRCLLGCVTVLTVLVVFTMGAEAIILGLQRPVGKAFDDYASFAAFMETPVDEEGINQVLPEDDDDWNLISFDSDNPDQFPPFRYRNQSVAYWSYGENVFPILVYTWDAIEESNTREDNIFALFIAVYVLEVLGVSVFYLRKKA